MPKLEPGSVCAGDFVDGRLGSQRPVTNDLRSPRPLQRPRDMLRHAQCSTVDQDDEGPPKGIGSRFDFELLLIGKHAKQSLWNGPDDCRGQDQVFQQCHAEPDLAAGIELQIEDQRIDISEGGECLLNVAPPLVQLPGARRVGIEAGNVKNSQIANLGPREPRCVVPQQAAGSAKSWISTQRQSMNDLFGDGLRPATAIASAQEISVVLRAALATTRVAAGRRRWPRSQALAWECGAARVA